ncbi:hypothetical protein AVEN_263282-1 [Araneus ventricosus]|uniref:Uncharacterized protein n=1 Tax=Araneus ventricosus TaxID=182803 RepID=A0A4Y2HHE4_ARAVE|nr:hypothetical protein AVEN_263282-1 [Araneus ventricosus]
MLRRPFTVFGICGGAPSGMECATHICTLLKRWNDMVAQKAFISCIIDDTVGVESGIGDVFSAQSSNGLCQRHAERTFLLRSPPLKPTSMSS